MIPESAPCPPGLRAYETPSVEVVDIVPASIIAVSDGIVPGMSHGWDLDF